MMKRVPPCFISRALTVCSVAVAVVVHSPFLMAESSEAAKSAEFTLKAEDGVGILLSPVFQADPRSREISAELAEILQKITGQEIKLEAGSAQRIVLGVAADFPELAKEAALDPENPFGREDYVIRSSREQLLLVGSTAAGVSLAVSDLLHRWGYRQFFPGKSWEIIPKAGTLSLNASDIQRPAFYFRDIFGTSYFPEEVEGFKRWYRLNRLGRGFQLNTRHSYNEIYKRNKAAFDAAPDYFASVDGKPQNATKKKYKFNAANPDLLQLLVKDAKTLLSADDAEDSVSMDPSDFGGWDNSGEAFKKIGSPSNQAVTMANIVAKEAAAPLKKYVGMYAYYSHQFPPDIAVEPNIIVSFATRFLKPDRDVYESIKSWRNKGVALVGIRDYHSFWDWDLAMPGRALGGNLHYLEEAIPKFHALGARFYTSESQSAWGAYGLGYYVTTRLLWNPQEDRKAIVADFLEKSFGPAAEPMARFYSLLNGDDSVLARYTTPAELYAPLMEAIKAANGDREICQRITELAAYVRYVELLGNLEKAQDEHKPEALRELYAWVFRTAPMQILPTRAIALRDTSGLRSLYKKYQDFPTSELETMQKNALENRVTTDEVLTLANAALANAALQARSVEPQPALAVAKQPASSPWMRYASCFVFPLEADGHAEATLLMRRFGFSEYPRYVVVNANGQIIQRGQLQSLREVVKIQAVEAGNYSIIAESTPNLLKCQSDRTFYLKPTRDFVNLEAANYTGSLYFAVPEGVSSQVATGGQGDGKKVNVKIVSTSGETVAAGEDVNGSYPLVKDLKAAASQGEYEIRFRKPGSGEFQDVFLKFNGSYSSPVSFFPHAFPAAPQANP